VAVAALEHFVPDVGLSLSAILSLVVLAPLCEELVMRPVLQRAFSLYWRPGTAVMATAFLFALLHASWLRFGETFILGLFCGILFLKTENYWASVLFHAVANAMGPVLFKYASSGRIDWLLNPMTTVALGGVALVAVWWVTPPSLVALTGFRRRTKWLFFGGGGQTVQLAKTRGMAMAYWFGAGLLMLALSAALTAEMNLYPRDVLRAEGEVVETDTEPISYALEPKGIELIIRARAEMRTGTVLIGIYGPDGELMKQVGGGKMMVGNWRIPLTTRGTHTLKMTPQRAAGHWEVQVRER
jgi:hypothetical protein